MVFVCLVLDSRLYGLVVLRLGAGDITSYSVQQFTDDFTPKFGAGCGGAAQGYAPGAFNDETKWR